MSLSTLEIRSSVQSVRRVATRRTIQRLLTRAGLTLDAVMAIPVAEAQAVANSYSVSVAGTATAVLLTPPDANPKLWKSSSIGRPTVGLTLLPSLELARVLSSVRPLDALSAAVLQQFIGLDACPWASPGCRQACLASSGRGHFPASVMGRAWRLALLIGAPAHFVRLLIHELEAWSRKFVREGVRGACRLNVLSDLDWTLVMPELCTFILSLPGFGPGSLYDYTKDASRLERGRALGYDLSLSAHEKSNLEALLEALRSGRANRIVIVFGLRAKKVNGAYPALPATFDGFPVIDGDVTDYRPGDGTGVIIGLRAKDLRGASSVAAGLASGFYRAA